MPSDKNIMRRGVHQALYKYLPGSWVDFTQSGGGVTYAVHVDRWNSVHLTNINNKRLLRVVDQRVSEFRQGSPDGPASVVNFSSAVNEENYYVLTPKVSEQERAIVTSVKPWVFVCNSCGRVRQYYSYEEFKRRERELCDVCKKHMLFISYDATIQQFTNEAGFPWYQGYKYVIDGSLITKFAEVAQKYSGYNIGKIQSELARKRKWFYEHNLSKGEPLDKDVLVTSQRLLVKNEEAYKELAI